MADDTADPNAGNSTPGPTSGPDSTSGPAAAADPAQDAARLAAEVDTLHGQIADLTDRMLRAHAEMDNIRKRAEREREETAKYAISKFARDIVTVADNFERAIQAVPAGAAEQDAALKSLVEGVSMTEREFLNVLERNGVKRINPKGEAFNPHHHQAMMEMQNPDVAPGTIVEVYQSGYMLEERVLRPAMVVVAKGGPKGGSAEAAAPEAPASDGAPSDCSETSPAGNDNPT
jgi:molecular chaperone GrpE